MSPPCEPNVDPLSAAIVNYSTASSQNLAAYQVSTAVMRKALDVQVAAAAALLQALPQQPSLASSGMLGTRLNVYA